MFPNIITEQNITVLIGKPVTIPRDNELAEEIIEAIHAGDEAKVKTLADTATAVKQQLVTAGVDTSELEMRDHTVYWLGEPLHNSLTTRIVQLVRQNKPVLTLVNFLRNLVQNPSQQSILEAYDFLQAANLPLTSDGHFLAYKRVREDYTDCHSGTVSNKVGERPSMPRAKVDDNRHNTCSTGYHFCSYSYLDHFWGDRIMVVKINPRDIVSIPSDYNNAKGRCCTYEVVGEIPTNELEKTRQYWDSSPVIEDYEDDAEYDADGYDANGYDEDGYDRYGYDADGYDENGYDRDGYDAEDFNVDGYDPEGFDRDGYDEDGYNRLGFDARGINRNGYYSDGVRA